MKKSSEEVMLNPFPPLTQANLVFIAIKEKLPNCKSVGCEFNKKGECWNIKCYSWWSKSKWQWVLCGKGIRNSVIYGGTDFGNELYKRK